MPDEIGWPTAEEEKALDKAAQAAASVLAEETPADDAELALCAEAAARYRERRARGTETHNE